MIELITLTILTLVVLSLIRPGKTPPLDNPLIIERPGHYHMTLAPQLNLAQPLIENIAQRLGKASDPGQESSTLCFEVHDKAVALKGSATYLLAVTQCHGLLYFQVIAAQAGYAKDRADALRSFAQAVLVNVPKSQVIDENLNERIRREVRDSALQRRITIEVLP